jgi:hypothetical protein
MKAKLVFHDWINDSGESVYDTIEGVIAGGGDLHHGSIFHGTIEFDEDTIEDLRRALAEGIRPVFYLVE